MVKERNKKSMRGSKKGVRVRRNCIVFNLNKQVVPVSYYILKDEVLLTVG
jgi:hypothetical protein